MTKESLPHVSEGQIKIERECHSKSKEDKVNDERKDVVDIDAEDLDNPFCCAEYAEEIYRYLRKREV